MADDEWKNPAADDEGSPNPDLNNQSELLNQQNQILSKELEIDRLKANSGDASGRDGMKEGVSDGIKAGISATKSLGNLTLNALGRPHDGGMVNLFVVIAVILSWSQATLGYRNRAHVFFLMLGVLGWFMVFKGDAPPLSRASLTGLAKSVGIAAVTWYWPVLFYKIPISFASPTVKLILVSAFNPYIIYFIFMDPMTPFLQKLEKIYIFAIIMIFLAWGIKGLSEGSLVLSPIPGVDTKAGLVLFWDIARDSTKIVYEWTQKGYEDMKTWVFDRIDYATGGALYSGQKDPEAQTRLGVYFRTMETATSEIYDNEAISVWAQIEASTLDDPIHMSISCLGDREEGSPNPKKNIPSDSLIPTEIDVDRKDRHDIDCMFNPGKIPAGSHKVSISVDFDFTTNAKQKAYFVDKERAQALARSDVDILDQYGIKDKTPVAIYTDGPMMIGMGFTNQPVKLDPSNNQPATLGISLQKRWEGTIKHINTMTIKMPNTMGLINSNCNGVLFKESVDGGSKIYTMVDPAKIKKFDPYRSFRCPIEFNDIEGILGSVPLATRFFQVEVSYEYEITRDLSVSIRNSTLYDSSTGQIKIPSQPSSTPTTPAASPAQSAETQDNDAAAVSEIDWEADK